MRKRAAVDADGEQGTSRSERSTDAESDQQIVSAHVYMYATKRLLWRSCQPLRASMLDVLEILNTNTPIT